MTTLLLVAAIVTVALYLDRRWWSKFFRGDR
jgi:hypothetical protein